MDLADIGIPRWFGQHEHYVFNDTNGDGIRQDGEPGIPDQTINLRFRDGSMYGTSTTDTEGYLPFDEIFPFFSWLIAEVDFARFRATGVTTTVDEGGAVSGDYDDPLDPAGGRRTVQIQLEDCTTPACFQRTETGPALLEGYNSFAGTSFKFEWGKQAYGAGENGGITGVVYNQVTRAENDPALCDPGRVGSRHSSRPGQPLQVQRCRRHPGHQRHRRHSACRRGQRTVRIRGHRRCAAPRTKSAMAYPARSAWAMP